MKRNKLFFIIFCITLIMQLSIVNSYAQVKNMTEIENFINEQMNEGKIPGMSVVIVQNDKTILKKGFGYADLQSNKKVTSDTLFELGSNSKAFTALGVLKLEQDGLININEPITKYIPWLIMKYNDKEVQITIEQFLHHTSGVPSSTIVNIPVSNDRDAIEKTVRTLIGIELTSNPGDNFQYATINYDVLGLLIEQVTGKKYEDYIKENVLTPIGLRNTYMYKDKIKNDNMAKGYKLGFAKPRYYKAPQYSGNKPAGYIISNAEDMAKWLKIQMNALETSSFDSKLIKNSHMPNSSIQPFGDGLTYADGWFINNRSEIFHSGSNPNYSSYIIFKPQEKIGVAVLCNIKSCYTSEIAKGIFNMVQGKDSNIDVIAFIKIIDKISIIIISIAAIIIILTIFFLIRMLKQISIRKRCFQLNNKKNIFKVITLSILYIIISCILYFIPYFLFNQSTWQYIFVWYPVSVKAAIYSIYICISIIFLTILLKNIFKKIN